MLVVVVYTMNDINKIITKMSDMSKEDVAKKLSENLDIYNSVIVSILKIKIEKEYNQTVEEFILEFPEYFI